MPVVRNPQVGGSLTASASAVSEGQMVLRDGVTAGTGAIVGGFTNIGSLRLVVPALNMPQLCWSLFLEDSYTDSVHGAFAPQMGITWQPFINKPRSSLGNTIGQSVDPPVPIAPAAILPIGVPVSFSTRCAVELITIEIITPAAAALVLNSIWFNISASQ